MVPENGHRGSVLYRGGSRSGSLVGSPVDAEGCRLGSCSKHLKRTVHREPKQIKRGGGDSGRPNLR